MVVKKGGKKGKKANKNNAVEKSKRKLLFREEEQEYCQVTRLLGNCKVEGNCFDGKIRLCMIRGGIKKKMRILVGSVVIVSLRDFEDGKCDIIYLYDKDEIKELIKLGELPETIKVHDDIVEDKIVDIGIDFVEEYEVNEEELEFKNNKETLKKEFEDTFKNI